MKNFYRLIQGDCLRVLPMLEDESVDLIFADPPYNIGKRGAKMIWEEKSFHIIDAKWDNIDEKKYSELLKSFIKESVRISKWGGSIFITGTSHNIFQVRQYLENEDLRFRNFITWFKPNAMPLRNADKGFFAYSCEYVCFYTKGQKEKIRTWNYNLLKEMNGGKQIRDMWSIKVCVNNKWGVPAQKPEELLKLIILATTRENDIILDPFLGSGTTMKVCQDLKRSCIGIEINPDYCEIVKKRCFGRQFLDREVEYQFEVFDK